MNKALETFYQLLPKKKINIDIGLNWVADRDKVAFASPLLLESDANERLLLKFLKLANTINIKITSKKVEGFRVYYSGTISDENGYAINFKDIDNNFCVNIG